MSGEEPLRHRQKEKAEFREAQAHLALPIHNRKTSLGRRPLSNCTGLTAASVKTGNPY